jgi:hypothetical protein
MDRYHVVATLASHMVISSTGKGGSQKDGGHKPRDRQGKQRSGAGGALATPFKALINIPLASTVPPPGIASPALRAATGVRQLLTDLYWGSSCIKQ